MPDHVPGVDDTTALTTAWEASWQQRADLMAHRPARETYRVHAAGRFPRDASVLDFGCGDGTFRETLQDRGHTGRYLGVDVSAEAIRLARERHPGTSFEVIDDTFAPSGWDVVVAMHVLEHQNPHRIEEFVRRLFAAAGVVVVSWFRPPAPNPTGEVWVVEREAMVGGFWQLRWDRAFMVGLFQAHGILDSAVRHDDRDYETWTWLRRGAP